MPRVQIQHYRFQGARTSYGKGEYLSIIYHD